jgi:hypothetical protein
MAVTGRSVQHGGPVSGGAATGNLGPILKEEWSDEVTSQFNNEALAYVLLSEGAEDELWQGEYYVEPLHTGRNRAGGPGRETDDYPVPGNQGFNQMQIGVAFYRTAGQITSKAMIAAEKGDAAAVRSLTSDIRGGLRDLIQEVNVDFYGTEFGILGEVAGIAGVAVTVRSALVGGRPRLWQTNGTRYFSGGRQQRLLFADLDEGDGGADAVRGRAIVQTVDSRTQITIDADPGIVVDDMIVRAPSNNATDNPAVTAESMKMATVGLTQICSDDTIISAALDTDYFTLSRAANPILDPLTRNMAGADVTEEVLQDFLDAIADSSGEVPHGLLMHRAVRTRLLRNFTPDRRFTPQKFNGGFQGQYLVYNPGDGDLHVYVDRHCVYDTIFAINTDHLKRYTLSGAHLVDYDGSALRQAGNAPVWQWNIEAYFNMASTKPNTCGVMYDVASDATFGIAGFTPEF